MPAYTGPIPPPPGQAATDAQWQAWWTYQTILQNMRYEDERATRVLVTDRQHAEKMQREDACAAATRELAAAQRAMAAAVLAPMPEARVTDEHLILQWMSPTAGSGVAAMAKARAMLLAYRLVYPAAAKVPTPEGGPELPPLPAPPKPPAPLNPSSTAAGPTGEQILPPAKKPQGGLP